jgi:ABC-type iron transport system FetAB permease component
LSIKTYIEIKRKENALKGVFSSWALCCLGSWISPVVVVFIRHREWFEGKGAVMLSDLLRRTS